MQMFNQAIQGVIFLRKTKIYSELFHITDGICISLLQCCGSMTFWSGSGSGSADPCLWLMDPDPAFFVIDLQDASKKLIFNTIFFCLLLFKGKFTSFFKIKCQKESQIKVFLTIFAWWYKDPDPDPYIWLVDPDPGGPKNMWIRWIRIWIRNTALLAQRLHCDKNAGYHHIRK